jgi:hypothetical protein
MISESQIQALRDEIPDFAAELTSKKQQLISRAEVENQQAKSIYVESAVLLIRKTLELTAAGCEVLPDKTQTFAGAGYKLFYHPPAADAKKELQQRKRAITKQITDEVAAAEEKWLRAKIEAATAAAEEAALAKQQAQNDELVSDILKQLTNTK